MASVQHVAYADGQVANLRLRVCYVYMYTV